jgi:hypothetical protein
VSGGIVLELVRRRASIGVITCATVLATTGCLPQIEERATVKRVGFFAVDLSRAPLEAIEVEFKACPDVSWTIYLGPTSPTAKPIAPSAASCLRALSPGQEVSVRVETKPFGGGVNGGSVAKIGSCVLRPKWGDTFEGGLSTGGGGGCKWARD